MRNYLMMCAFVAPLALLPATASAQSTSTGAAAGATTGAVGGAIIGGPVGAVIGGAAGAVAGGAVGAASEPQRVYVAPAPGTVVERDCVQRTDGSQDCVETRR